MVSTNLSGAFYLTRAATAIMRRQGKGLSVYIGCSGAKRPDQSGVGYQASKAGLAVVARRAGPRVRWGHLGRGARRFDQRRASTRVGPPGDGQPEKRLLRTD